MSDIVAQYILHVLEESDGNAEIQRNELAGELGCVPSQINYVITSRFTPEQGYLVESRRGGGGYIRITRVKMDHSGATVSYTHLVWYRYVHICFRKIMPILKKLIGILWIL